MCVGGEKPSPGLFNLTKRRGRWGGREREGAVHSPGSPAVGASRGGVAVGKPREAAGSVPADFPGASDEWCPGAVSHWGATSSPAGALCLLVPAGRRALYSDGMSDAEQRLGAAFCFISGTKTDIYSLFCGPEGDLSPKLYSPRRAGRGDSRQWCCATIHEKGNVRQTYKIDAVGGCT